MDERQTVLQTKPMRPSEDQRNDSVTELQPTEQPRNNETVAFGPGQIPMVESHGDGMVNQLDSAASLLAAVNRSEMGSSRDAALDDTHAAPAGVGNPDSSSGSIEESIEDYMAALMQRCQGHSNQVPAAATSKDTSSTVRSANTSRSAVARKSGLA